MKKTRIVFLAVIISLMTIISSCDIMGNRNHFVGSWRSTNLQTNHELVFTESDVYIYTSSGGSNGTYTYTDSNITFNWNSGGYGTFSYFFTNNNNNLTINDNSGPINYSRQ